MIIVLSLADSLCPVWAFINPPTIAMVLIYLASTFAKHHVCFCFFQASAPLFSHGHSGLSQEPSHGHECDAYAPWRELGLRRHVRGSFDQ